MPVLNMSEVGWDNRQAMLANGQETVGGPRQHNMGARSQDDAMVGYFFQRPQTDAELSSYNNKRWAVGDDSMIEQTRNVGVNDLERDFQGLSVGRDIGPHGKKIWDIGEDPNKGGNNKGVFHQGSPWAPPENSWDAPAGMVGHEHSVSQPIQMVQRRPGSFPSNDTHSVLSPRSETSALGVNMVEYVLGGGSPTGKELDNRLRMKAGYPPGKRAMFQVPPQEGGQDAPMEKKTKTPSPFEGGDQERVDMDNKENNQANGILQNGLDDGFSRSHGSRQNSPTHEENKMPLPHQQMGMDPQKMVPGRPDNSFLEQHPHLNPASGFQLDPPQFEPVGIDPIQFDYSSQLVSSMDSPNFNMDYSQQQLLQRQQQPIAVLTQQQYALAAQQQQLGSVPPTAISAPYVISTSQDPYAVGIPFTGPVIHPQYYGIQTPWGIYPANIIQQQGQGNPQQPQLSQQQQQQVLRGQNGRPLTPSQQNEAMGTPNSTLPAQPLQTPGAGYQILAPAYYDQNGQLVMGNPRGLGTPVRLVSPAPVLVSAAAAGNQQGGGNGLGNNPLRLLSTQSGQVQNPPVVYSSNSNSSTPQTNAMGYTPSNSLGYTPVTTSLFTPISNSLGLTPQQSTPFANNSLGSSTPGTIGSGLNGQRRDSLDFAKQRPIPPLSQYYNSLGGMAGSPAGPMGLVQPGQAITPPPSLTGSNSNLTLGFGNGRLPSAAPGAENKYRNGPMTTANGLFGGSSLFPARSMSRSASLSKEVTGRSRLLEDFRNNRIPNLQLKDLVNHVVEFSQDQHGSRFIQQKLERATPAEKAMVFSEILTAAYSLMTDVFGNYVIQKFFEFGSSDQKQTLAQRVRGHVLPLALQMYGCRVIQKALESIPPDMQVEIVKELDGHVLKCVKDQNGNHVVQKCIECVEPKHLQFIIDAFKGQVYTLSTHPYGCRVIQRILEHCTTDQTMPILEELHDQVDRLVQDQYGNYVVQHVLEHGRPEDKSKIINMIRGKVLLLSQHKFASNVVEKCVSHSSRAEKAILIEEVCSVNDGALYTMMKDQFANYVVQKMIDVAEPPQRKILMHKIRPHVATLRKYTYGKHILTKLEKFLMKTNPGDLGPIGMPPNGALQ